MSNQNIFQYYNPEYVVKIYTKKEEEDLNARFVGSSSNQEECIRINKEMDKMQYNEYHAYVNNFLNKLTKLQNIKKKLSQLMLDVKNNIITVDKKIKDYVKKLKEERDNFIDLLDKEVQNIGMSSGGIYAKSINNLKNILVKGFWDNTQKKFVYVLL